MDELEQARQEIDAVDAQLAALFERRMRAVVQVALYKKARGLPIHDPAREEQVLQKAADRIQDPALRPYYLDHVRNRMAVARQYEALLLGQNRVAYQGVEGAFAHIALRELFPHAEAVSCPTWDEVFARVSAGDAAYGVVPFENSHAGDVSAVLDLCYNHPELWVVQVYDLPVQQNLLGLLLLSVLKWEGATRVCDPREHFREPTKKGGDRHSNRLPTFVIFSIFPCGEIGIRTRDTILSYTRFPGVPLKPLEHLSC